MGPSPSGPFEGDGALIFGDLAIVKFSVQDVFLEWHEMQPGTRKSCMFLLAILAGDCLIFIYHYLCPITQEAVVLIIFVKVRQGGFELVKGQSMDYGVVSSSQVIFALDLGEELGAQEEGLLLLASFDSVCRNSVQDRPWSPAGETYLPFLQDVDMGFAAGIADSLIREVDISL